MIATCEYCKRSQQFETYNGQCVSCGGALPKPKPRLVERTFRIHQSMIDVTSWQDTSTVYVPGVRDVQLTEKVLE
jgi:hypothetical protein